MKRIILSALSVLALSSFVAPAAFAESASPQAVAVTSATLNRSNTLQLSPNDLVTAAYRGRFINQGIPSYAQLHHDYAVGRVTAEELVRVAIAQGQLSPETLMDRGYLGTVDTKLKGLASS